MRKNDKRIHEIRVLNDAGESVADIADILGISPSTVYYHMRANIRNKTALQRRWSNQRRRVKLLALNGWRPSEIARHMDIDSSYVSKLIKK